jgi:hypothetical protein
MSDPMRDGFHQDSTRGTMRDPSRFRRVAGFVSTSIGLTVLVLCVIEGAASYLAAGHELLGKPTAPDDSKHTQYDPELGWVNAPNVYLPNMYGYGIGFRSNSQGFRNSTDIAPSVPRGKVRIICSGDSFTMGQGVRDEESWCYRLQELAPQLETVNMGQAGYGVDQAYLWAKRDAATLERQVHLLAFITADIYRMQRNSHHGYAKPVLALEGGTIVTRNVPVPRASYRWHWVRAIQVARGLSTFRAVDWMLRAFSGSAQDQTETVQDTETKGVLRVLLADLQRENQRHGGTVVLVYLPTIGELTAGGPPGQWWDFMKALSDSLDIPLLDLYGPVMALPQVTITTLFLPDEHYSPLGHTLIARLLLQELSKDPRTLSALERAFPPAKVP